MPVCTSGAQQPCFPYGMYENEVKHLSRADIESAVKSATDAVALHAAGQLSADECRKCCLACLRILTPERRKITLADGARAKLTTASFDVLLSCIENDASLALKLLAGEDSDVPAYRQVERLFRPVAEASAGQGTGLVHNTAEAISIGGAIDVGPAAAWRVCNGGDGVLPAGVRVVQPPAHTLPQSAPVPAAGHSASSLEAEAASLCVGGIYTLSSRPGLYILPSCLDADTQRSLILSILCSYIERPNRRNIDAAVDPDESNKEWALQHGQDVSTLGGGGGTSTGSAGLRPGGGQRGGYAQGLWAQYMASLCAAQEGQEGLWAQYMASLQGQPALPLEKLTWATLGYQYDWTARAYRTPGDPDYARHAHAHAASHEGGEGHGCTRWHAPFPADLQALSTSLMAEVDGRVRASVAQGHTTQWDYSGTGPPPPGVSPDGLPLLLHGQAGIVNLYPATSKLPMGGHKDDMERTYAAPVLSLSLGCTAVFLAGGASKEVRPIPILLHSGDCLVLAGASRLALHGVARVFQGTSPPGLFTPGMAVTHAATRVARVFQGTSPPGLFTPGMAVTHAATRGARPGLLPEVTTTLVDEAWAQALHTYLAGHRLNINVRQVLPSVHGTPA